MQESFNHYIMICRTVAGVGGAGGQRRAVRGGGGRGRGGGRARRAARAARVGVAAAREPGSTQLRYHVMTPGANHTQLARRHYTPTDIILNQNGL